MTMGSALVAVAERRVEDVSALLLEAKYLDEVLPADSFLACESTAAVDAAVVRVLERASCEEAGLEPAGLPPKKVESEA